MRWKWYTSVLSSAMVLCSAYAVDLSQGVFAQGTEQAEGISESERDYLQRQLKQMEETMQKQQEQIQALKNRIDTISTAPAPITKEEIKHEIEDYLSTEDAREKMALGLPGVTALYTPDEDKYSVVFRSPDDRYSLGIGGRLQFRYTYKDNDEDVGGTDKMDIDVRRARLCLGGNVYSKLIHYYVELDGDSFDVGIRDFYIYFTPLDELNAKVGYFKVPFNQQRMTSSAKLLLIDRAIASEAFDQDRDYGVDIYGKPFDGYMEYHAAVFQGAGEDPLERPDGRDENLDNELMYVLNLRYNPFGKYDYADETDVKYTEKFKATVGASVVFNAKKGDEKLEDTDAIAGVVELSMKYRGFSWHNEYFVMTEDPEGGGDSLDSDGFFTQAGYFVIPKRLEVAARYSLLDPDNDASDDFGREYTAGINYYFRAHRSKIQADFSHYVTEQGEEPNNNQNRFRVQYQIVF
ncbi:MAG: porin [Candidatus Jettenia sp.]|nr:MAG: porin [Candidatus Jettenia sp.]